MKVGVAAGPLESVKADAIVVGVYAEEKRLREAAARIDRALDGQLSEVLEAERFASKPAHVTHVHTGGRMPAGRVVVVGLGKRVELTLETIRHAAAAGLRRARDLGAKSAALEVLGDRLPARSRAHAATEGALLGAYTFDRYKREKTDKRVESLTIVEARSRRRPGSGSRSSTAPSARRWAWGCSSASPPAASSRRSSSISRTRRPVAAAGAWPSSARASRSTPAAST